MNRQRYHDLRQIHVWVRLNSHSLILRWHLKLVYRAW